MLKNSRGLNNFQMHSMYPEWPSLCYPGSQQCSETLSTRVSWWIHYTSHKAPFSSGELSCVWTGKWVTWLCQWSKRHCRDVVCTPLARSLTLSLLPPCVCPGCAVWLVDLKCTGLTSLRYAVILDGPRILCRDLCLHKELPFWMVYKLLWILF